MTHWTSTEHQRQQWRTDQDTRTDTNWRSLTKSCLMVKDEVSDTTHFNPAIYLDSLLTYVLTYSLTPWSRVLLENLIGFQPVKKFPAFYGTRRFITALTSAHHLSLSWASSIRSISPHPISWRYIFNIILPSTPGCSKCFPPGFHTKTQYTPRLSPIRAKCLPNFILLNLITQIFGEEYGSLSSQLCSLLHSPVTSSFLGPNILLCTLFSNTLSLCSYLNVSVQVSHPHKKQPKL